ncbi:MAG: hypothetical protein HY272_05450 [Gammaproteobacteria bacterium]|nr:hypothetical protein [Gammaproteobacteria bacterium]
MKDRICTACYHVGKPTTQGIESFFVDALIWLSFSSFAILSAMIPLMIIPIAWTTFHIAVYNKTTCPKCGKLNMVSLNSRKGREALKGPKFVISYTATEEEAEKIAAAIRPEQPERRQERRREGE